MLLKKTALLGVMLAVSPLVAQAADLVTTNYTHEFSTVSVTSTTPNRCAGTVPPPFTRKFTPPASSNGTPGTSRASQAEVNLLCGRILPTVHTCTALIYMTANCTGPAVARATMNLDSPNFGITTITPTAEGSKYKISGSGLSVVINYA